MTLIQVILSVSIFILALLYLTRLRSRILDRLLVLAVFVFGIVFVLFPDLTMKIAHFVGVGRGTDLLLYMAIVGLGFVLLMMYSKMRNQHQMMTRIIRIDAMRNAKFPKKQP